MRSACLWIAVLACIAFAAQAAVCPAKKGLKGRSCAPCADKLCSDCQDNYQVCNQCAQELWDPSNPISYYVDASSGRCTSCETSPPTKSCDVTAGCNSEGQCNKCKRGYGLIGGACTQCAPSAGAGCANCDGDIRVCKRCADIENDEGASFITGRNAGFMLVGGSCQQCRPNDCASCPGNLAMCKRCVAGMGLSNGRCIGCQPGCGYGNGGTCAANGRCTKCDPWFGLVGSKCLDCEDSNDLCEACDGNEKACKRCVPDMGVVLDPRTRSCKQCKAANCLACPTAASTSCTKCVPGYGVVRGKCAKCATKGCKNCDGDASKCRECVPDLSDDLQFYFLDVATQTCAAFPAHIA